jgi:hypothetical protein
MGEQYRRSRSGKGGMETSIIITAKSFNFFFFSRGFFLLLLLLLLFPVPFFSYFRWGQSLACRLRKYTYHLNLQLFATLYKSRGKHMGLSIPSSLARKSS